jgi:hypothetical protein
MFMMSGCQRLSDHPLVILTRISFFEAIGSPHNYVDLYEPSTATANSPHIFANTLCILRQQQSDLIIAHQDRDASHGHLCDEPHQWCLRSHASENLVSTAFNISRGSSTYDKHRKCAISTQHF